VQEVDTVCRNIPKHKMATYASTHRLEHFLDSVLRRELTRVLTERDNCYNAASQCVQLRQLLADLNDLGKVRQATVSVVADDVPISEEATRLANAGEDRIVSSNDGTADLSKISPENRKLLEEMMGADGDINSRTVLHKTITVADALVGDPVPLQLLCDVSGNTTFEVEGKYDAASSSTSPSDISAGGSASNNQSYHFFMTADIPNPAVVHVNIGCGVVCPMTHEEANLFLKKKEQLYRDQSQRLSRESLRVRFRIRLVMEAITRMQETTVTS